MWGYTGWHGRALQSCQQAFCCGVRASAGYVACVCVSLVHLLLPAAGSHLYDAAWCCCECGRELLQDRTLRSVQVACLQSWCLAPFCNLTRQTEICACTNSHVGGLYLCVRPLFHGLVQKRAENVPHLCTGQVLSNTCAYCQVCALPMAWSCEPSWRGHSLRAIVG